MCKATKAGYLAGKKIKNRTRGFTLIELLVVVLIIGILAAVALPQYNKAVKRAQGREVFLAINTLDKALADYYLTHGTYAGITEDVLSVQIPNLKYFVWGAMSGGRTHQFSIATAARNSATAESIRIHMTRPVENGDLSWEWYKGTRTTRASRMPSKWCPYFDGVVTQVGTNPPLCEVNWN